MLCSSLTYSRTPLYVLSAIRIFDLRTIFFKVISAIRTKISLYVLYLTYSISICVLSLMYSVSGKTRQRSVLSPAIVNIGPKICVHCGFFFHNFHTRPNFHGNFRIFGEDHRPIKPYYMQFYANPYLDLSTFQFKYHLF